MKKSIFLIIILSLIFVSFEFPGAKSSNFPIKVDGSVNDWTSNNISPIIKDMENDSILKDPSQDIKEVYATVFNNNLYVGIKLFGTPKKDRNIEYCFWFDTDDEINGNDFFVGLENGKLWYYYKKLDGSSTKLKYINFPVFAIKDAVELKIPLSIMPNNSGSLKMCVWIHNYKLGDKAIDKTYEEFVPVWGKTAPDIYYYIDCSNLKNKEVIVNVKINNVMKKEITFTSRWYIRFLGSEMKWAFDNFEAKDGSTPINILERIRDSHKYLKLYKSDGSPIENLSFTYRKTLNKKYVQNYNFYFGYVTKDEYIDATAYLLLEPLNIDAKSVYLHFFNMPKGWKIATIWKKVGENTFVIHSQEEAFERNAFVAGNYCSEITSVDGVSFVIIFPKSTEKEIRERYVQYIEKTAKYMDNLWKCIPFTEKQYLLVVTPKIPDGDIVGAEANRSDMVPFYPIPDFMMEFSHHLFHSRNSFPPCGFHTVDSTRWFLEGTNVFYNRDKVQIALKLDFLHKEMKKYFDNYLSTMFGTNKDFPVSYNTGVSGPKIFYDKGALVSFLLDYEIKEVTQGKKSLDDLLPIIYEKYSPCILMGCINCYKTDPNIPPVTNEVLIKTLKELTGYDFTDFFNKYVFGKEKLNLSKYFIDSDNDGLSNVDETYLGTNPAKWDTDGGGISDGDELLNGTNPLNKNDDFSFDKLPPNLFIYSPDDKKITNKKSISIFGKVEDKESGINILKINGKIVEIKDNGDFEEEISLKEGENKINIVAVDNAGNKTEKALIVTVDTTPPVVKITAPANFETVNEGSITVSGTATDSSSGIDTVTVNGNAVTVASDGSFSTSVSLTEGDNTITIVATDKAGNKTTKTITVTYRSQIVITLQPSNPYMTVNGVQQEIDPGRGTKPVIIPKWGRTVVPIRAIVEALGGTIGWDGKERKVTINFNGTVINLWIDNPKAKVNGETKWIDPNNHDVKPIIVNSRTMLPLRFVAESLGCKVDWDAATRTITITYTP